MATTNWSKVERLKLDVRVGVATRLMDRVPYGEIRAWLTSQGVLEEALPSDRSMHGYTDTLEYGCLMQQRLDAHPELAGRSEPNPAAMGLEPTGGALSADGFVASAKRWLTIRLMVAERTQKVFDHAAMMADRFEERLLMELEMACQERDEDAEEEEDDGGSACTGDVDTNKESPFPDGVKGMERQLLAAAAKLPEVSPEDLQKEAFWMARRNRLERDPRMLKPAVFARLVGQMMRIMKEAKQSQKASGVNGRIKDSLPIIGKSLEALAALRADSAGFGARTGVLAKPQSANTAAPAPRPQPLAQTVPQPQPVGLRADSAGFGVSAAPAAPRSQSVAQSVPQPQPVGLRADSAAFGASANTPPAATPVATPAAPKPVPTTVGPAYAAAFFKAGREDGLGSLEDVPASFVARAHASGWTPHQAVREARKVQRMIASGAAGDAVNAQGHSDGNGEVRVG